MNDDCDANRGAQPVSRRNDRLHRDSGHDRRANSERTAARTVTRQSGRLRSNAGGAAVLNSRLEPTRDALHQLVADRDVEFRFEFAHTSRARHVDFRQIVANYI